MVDWLPSNGTPIPLKAMSDDMLSDLLTSLKSLAEIKKKQTYNFYRNMAGELEGYGFRCCMALKDLTWKDYVEPIFHDLKFQAEDRKLEWENISEEPIDLNLRGKLERLIVGAVKDSINAHGPVTHHNASSVGKRVIGVIKHFNKGLRHDNA